MTRGKQTSELGQRFLQMQESSLCLLLMNRSIPMHVVTVSRPRLTGSLLKYSFPLKRTDVLIPRVFMLLTNVKFAFLIDFLVINTSLTLNE